MKKRDLGREDDRVHLAGWAAALVAGKYPDNAVLTAIMAERQRV